MEYTHACIKCRSSYQDKDPEPYYCATCNEERLALAKQIDEQVKARQSARQSDRKEHGINQMIEELGQKHPRYGNTPFFRASDLGINF